MKRRLRWLQIMTGGLLAACLCLIGYLFLTHFFAGKTEETSAAVSGMQTAGGIQRKKIALTFDDGPHPVYTPMLLEGLKKRGVKATFFLMGTAVENYPEVAKQIAQDGHLIGNHTYHHVSLERADEETIAQEVLAANELIEEMTGQYPQFIRPPYGQGSSRLEQQTGMICVLWTIDPLDWCSRDAAKVAQSVISKAKENSIILLHDEYKTSVMAALTIVDELQKDGYDFVTVDELLLD